MSRFGVSGRPLVRFVQGGSPDHQPAREQLATDGLDVVVEAVSARIVVRFEELDR